MNPGKERPSDDGLEDLEHHMCIHSYFVQSIQMLVFAPVASAMTRELTLASN